MNQNTNDSADLFVQSGLIVFISIFSAAFVWFLKTFIWIALAKFLYWIFYYVILLASLGLSSFWLYSEIELKKHQHRLFFLAFVFLFLSVSMTSKLYERWFVSNTVTAESQFKTELKQSISTSIDIDKTKLNKQFFKKFLQDFFNPGIKDKQKMVYSQNLPAFLLKNQESLGPSTPFNFESIEVTNIGEIEKDVFYVDFASKNDQNKSIYARFFIRISDNKILIDIPASLGINELPLDALITTKPEKIITLRLKAKLSDFYANGKFSDFSHLFYATRLVDYSGGIIWGYFRKDTATGKEIYDVLKDGLEHQITLDIKIEETTCEILALRSKTFFIK